MSQGLTAAGRGLGWSCPLQWHHELAEQLLCGLLRPMVKKRGKLCLIERHSMDRWTQTPLCTTHVRKNLCVLYEGC